VSSWNGRPCRLVRDRSQAQNSLIIIVRSPAGESAALCPHESGSTRGLFVPKPSHDANSQHEDVTDLPAIVRWRPLMFVAIVSRLVTRSPRPLCHERLLRRSSQGRP
jgi:hypothetical protein